MMKRSIAAFLAVPLLAACGQVNPTVVPSPEPQTETSLATPEPAPTSAEPTATPEAPSADPSRPSLPSKEASATATPKEKPTGKATKSAPPATGGVAVQGPSFLLTAPKGWVVDKPVSSLGALSTVQISKGRSTGALQQVTLEVTRDRTHVQADVDAAAKQFAAEGCPNAQTLAPRMVGGAPALAIMCNEDERESQHFFFLDSGRIYSLSYLVDGTKLQEDQLSFIVDNLHVKG